MHAWESIQLTLEYIEAHLAEDIKIDALAKIAALSPFYYQRLFSRLVKRPVREYIKLRRLARAEEMLTDKGRRILDIALDCGFSSHESFTRTFKMVYGITPEQQRANPALLNHFIKPDLLLGYVSTNEGVPLVSDGIVLEINRKSIKEPVTFVGFLGQVAIDGHFPLGEVTGVDAPGEVWTLYHREKHRLPILQGGRKLGVAYLGDAPEGCFTYFAGAEMAPGEDSERYAAFVLPAKDYVVCGFEAANFDELTRVALDKAMQYCNGWLAEHWMRTEPFLPEMYYDDSPEGTYMELWFPVQTENNHG